MISLSLPIREIPTSYYELRNIIAGFFTEGFVLFSFSFLTQARILLERYEGITEKRVKESEKLPNLEHLRPS